MSAPKSRRPSASPRTATASTTITVTATPPPAVITSATGNCWAVHTNCPVAGPVPTSPANHDFKPGFATALMNKDLGLAMAAVASSGASAPLGSHATQIYARFAEQHADLDFSAVIQTLR